MVAYSFAPQFIEPIVSGSKRQTVRGLRKRHARAGEHIQIYTAMRTKYCRKILTPDPICISVKSIWLRVQKRTEHLLEEVQINGIALDEAEIEQFAIDDGFAGGLCDGFARRRMGEFWLKAHAFPDTLGLTFDGVIIGWKPDA